MWNPFLIQCKVQKLETQAEGMSSASAGVNTVCSHSLIYGYM